MSIRYLVAFDTDQDFVDFVQNNCKRNIWSGMYYTVEGRKLHAVVVVFETKADYMNAFDDAKAIGVRNDITIYEDDQAYVEYEAFDRAIPMGKLCKVGNLEGGFYSPDSNCTYWFKK